MQSHIDNDLREEVYGICRKLEKMIPPVDLNSLKADEIISYWLPEIHTEVIKRLKRSYLSENKR